MDGVHRQQDMREARVVSTVDFLDADGARGGRGLTEFDVDRGEARVVLPKGLADAWPVRIREYGRISL